MLTRFCTILTALLLGLSATTTPAQPSFGGFNDVESPVTISIEASDQTVVPGSTFVIAVTLDHEDGFHTWPNTPIIPEELGDFPATATTITPDLPDALSAGPIQWPDTHTVQVRFLGPPIDLVTYDGKAVAFIPIRVAQDAPLGELTIPIDTFYQACDEMICFQPTLDQQSITITIAQDAEASEPNPLFAGFDPAVFSNTDAWDESIVASTDTETTNNQRQFLGLFVLPPIDSAAGIAVIALAAAFGGFILNLTPCVLPVIPLKVMTITNHAGESKSRAIKLGLMMALGVITFWVGIGLPVAFVADFVDPSIIFGIWWVTGLIGVLIALMGVGIMGLFTIKLPQKTYMINPKADSSSGSFMFGIMTAILGLPCFGFVAGALLAGAATMQPWQVMIIFFSLGFGMAFPYFVLTLNPNWMNKIPKTGPASELVKQVMGLLMLAAAAYFLGTTLISIASSQQWGTPWWFKAIHWWVIAFFTLAAGGLLLVRTIGITKKLAPRLTFSVLGLLFATSGIAVAANQTSHQYHYFWEPYSQTDLEAALASGQVVVLDFTAEWCLNCKALEATVLAREPVKPLLLSGGVVPMVADLTSTSAPGWDKLRDLGQTGIPLLVVYEPGNTEPIWLSNAYNSNQVVEAIEQAMGQ
ncbi:MAG: thioredoxin family protein [Phycisphaerales bacterium]|nr:thioredoxin family protein [Phycisphaerales bacterium]